MKDAEATFKAYGSSLDEEFAKSAKVVTAVATATTTEALFIKWLLAKPADLKDKIAKQDEKFLADGCVLDQMHKSIRAAAQKAQR